MLRCSLVAWGCLLDLACKMQLHQYSVIHRTVTALRDFAGNLHA